MNWYSRNIVSQNSGEFFKGNTCSWVERVRRMFLDGLSAGQQAQCEIRYTLFVLLLALEGK